AQRFALAAGRTGETPSLTRTIAGKAAPYPQGEALSATRFVGWLLGTPDTLCLDKLDNHPTTRTMPNLTKLLHSPSTFSITKKPDLQTRPQFKASPPTNALTDETALTLAVCLDQKAPCSLKPI
ncbi:MAG: hypothetical protein QXD70_03440, partial [Candidatus Bathyarchaeia archaeon]